MAIKDYTREQEGHEITLSSNRFNRFLLTDLLVLKIQAIASASSALPAPGSPKKAGRLMTVVSLPAYQLGFRRIAFLAVHPGGIMVTNLAHRLTMENFKCTEETSQRHKGTVTW
ncbi:retinol dehydrogenase 13 [Apiospora kogelbergensis]|uniref:retinol dehydrogenase 13 n=1 Tax=Apiospora kogelbergensis TaxID=1337665 RepID=UPI00312F9C9A